eukprot:3389407-Rhodomonas_salina.1
MKLGIPTPVEFENLPGYPDANVRVPITNSFLAENNSTTSGIQDRDGDCHKTTIQHCSWCAQCLVPGYRVAVPKFSDDVYYYLYYTGLCRLGGTVPGYPYPGTRGTVGNGLKAKYLCQSLGFLLWWPWKLALFSRLAIVKLELPRTVSCVVTVLVT